MEENPIDLIQAEEFYDNLLRAADGYLTSIVVSVTATFVAEMAIKNNPDEKAIRGLYNDFANAAIAMMKNDNNQLQAEKNTSSKEEGAAPKQKTGYVIKPSGFN